jgi:hypothetical protein
MGKENNFSRGFGNHCNLNGVTTAGPAQALMRVARYGEGEYKEANQREICKKSCNL